MSEIRDIVQTIGRRSSERFAEARAISSFEQFLELLFARPASLTRSAPQYIVDMMDYYGSRVVATPSGPQRRFCVFDDVEGGGDEAVVGQERVQNDIYRCLREFIQKRKTDRMLLLHGPNGSSKTSLVHALMLGLERYSLTEEGMLLRFNWIFSEAVDRGERLGFDPALPEEDLESFAFLDPDRISAKIPCELSDNPIFLIPSMDRDEILQQAFEHAGDEQRRRFQPHVHLRRGDLSPKSRKIYDALMKAYQGDWKKVMRHVQVERWAMSRRFRSGVVTIEPQTNIDAQSRQIGHTSMNGLPAILQNETVFEAHGDLIDANRGIVEYSDFLKRPIEANKYLLTTAETGVINLASFTAWIDLVLIGTSNENYLSAFRRDPLFSSFKARLDLVRVPYLLSVSNEEELYRREFNKLPSHLGVAPHTSRIAALWAVMTRLMEPAGTDLDDETRRIVETLTPLEKAKLYDGGEAPARLAPTDQNRLRAALPDIASEYDTLEMEFEGQWDAAYEGRRGCSPREMLTMISEIALDPPGDCVTPMLVLKRLPDLIKDPGLYQFLRIKRTRNGYHDCHGFIEAVRDDYLDLVRHDVERAAELVDEGEFRRLFDDYFKHVRAQQTNERVLNEKTGAHGAPDEKFMKRIEELLEAGSDAKAFRSELLTKAASFRLSNPDQKMVHVEVFADLFHRMRENAFRQRLEGAKRIVEDSLVQLDVLPGSPDAERRADAELFLKRMTTELGYSEYSAREALEFFYRNINRFISP